MKDFLLSLASKVLSQLIVRKVELLLALLSPILSGALLYLRYEIAPLLSDPTGWLALKAISLSAALLPLPFVAYFWFKPKFKHISSIGVHENIKTGAYFCSYCLISNKLQSPLVIKHKALSCSVCGKFIPLEIEIPEPINLSLFNNKNKNPLTHPSSGTS